MCLGVCLCVYGVYLPTLCAVRAQILSKAKRTGEEGAEAVVGDVEQLVLVTANHGHGGGVRGRDDVLQLLTGEDVGRGEVSLRVAVLPGLGGGHVHHLRIRKGKK